ncbi:MAG: phospholipase D family protein [Candidatus Delongbacteria bacterium]
MLMGIGKVPIILETREIEDALLQSISQLDENKSAWIITPYLTIEKLSTIRRAISEACKRKATVNVVVRDEPEQLAPAKQGLSEAISHGLNLFAFHRLHAKLYWFENDYGIVTSANLVDGSFEASTELGLYVPAGTLHNELREWITKVIEPGLRSVNSQPAEKKFPKFPASKPMEAKSAPNTNGFCIRCSSSINLSPEKPYCIEHYRSWSYYSNPDFEEKVCHSCGKPNKSTMNKPVCYACFKAKR